MFQWQDAMFGSSRSGFDSRWGPGSRRVRVRARTADAATGVRVCVRSRGWCLADPTLIRWVRWFDSIREYGPARERLVAVRRTLIV